MPSPAMILRNVAIQHGRKALAPSLRKCCLRSLTTEALQHESSAIERSIANHSKETHSIEANINQLHLTKSFVSPSASGPRRSNSQTRRDHALSQHIKRTTSRVGAVVEPHYLPHEIVKNPPRPEDVTLELLMASQSHLGHVTSLWNPMNQRYIFGIRQGVHIISLETTAAHLRRAAKVVEGVAYHGGLILFVGTRPGQGPAIVNAARMSKGYHLFEKWVPGSITNGDQILARCRIRALDVNDDPIDGFEEKLAEWRALKPDLVVCLNPLENYVLLHECGLNNIPTIGVIDTDADPTLVTYPIPANDDSLRCMQVFAGVLGRAGEEGQKKRLEAARSGEITWQPPPGLDRPLTEEDEKKRREARMAEDEALAESMKRAQAKALADARHEL